LNGTHKFCFQRFEPTDQFVAIISRYIAQAAWIIGSQRVGFVGDNEGDAEAFVGLDLFTGNEALNT
jgi:hypothetical protein